MKTDFHIYNKNNLKIIINKYSNCAKLLLNTVFIMTQTTILIGLFICHFITDYLTSRWTSKLYKQEKYYGFPAFFSVIGLDQFLHYLQLILCYEYFTTL